MTRPLAPLGDPAAAASGADDASDAPEPDRDLVSEADVERFRTDVFLETTEVDAEIARFEAEAAEVDSLAALAYGEALERLRASRRALQARVDSLRPVAAEAFASAQASIEDDLGALRTDIDRARFDVALTGDALQARARREVARLDPVYAALRADTAAAARQTLDSLVAQRGRLDAGLDTLRRVPDERVDAVRLQVVRSVDALRQAVEAAAPDSLALSPSDSGSTPR